MNWANAGKGTVLLCILFCRPAMRAVDTLWFRLKLRREIRRAQKDWARGYREWRQEIDERERRAS